MAKNSNNRPKPVKPMTEEQRRKRRLRWMCAVLAVLNLIALALLILLPYNCTGIYNHGNKDTLVVIDSVIHVHEHDTVPAEQPSEMSDEIDEAVEGGGGDTDAFMRFSIMWNENGRDLVDLDAHAMEPNGSHIYFDTYRRPRRTRCGGQLDVDMQSPRSRGVENIVWPSADQLDDGEYEFVIDNYNNRQFSVCNVKLKVGDKSFIYKVGHFGKRNPVEVAVVTIKNHQVENIRHIQRPVSE